MIKVCGEFVVGVNGNKAFVVEPLTVGGAMDALEAATVEHARLLSREWKCRDLPHFRTLALPVCRQSNPG